jgi:glycosyltransferase involved in cell wall biosynthesis
VSRAERIAFISPRFADGDTVGGAETLLRRQAEQAARAGRQVVFLTTCAVDHFTWRNALPAGRKTVNGVDVHFFPVDEDRDESAFLEAQRSICSGRTVDEATADTWLRNSVNSRALLDHLRGEGAAYDRLVMGPYLFGLVYHAAAANPGRSLLVPCLHDEAFAYLPAFGRLFRSVRGCMFNTGAERDLALRLYGMDAARCSVVGMGIDRFNADAVRFSRPGLKRPYVIYCGRRETLKGTPLLCDYMATFRARTGRDVGLLFTGSGPIEAPPELAAHLVDAGFVSEQDKHDAMAGAVAFCHPSVNESLGIVLLESWMAGTPALVHAGSAVLREHCAAAGGGLWFRTYPDFEEELMALLGNADLRARMGAAGRRYVLNAYGWDKIAEKMLAVLDG